MKLTEEQKQSICTVYERAMTLRESLPRPIYITFDIDHWSQLRIDVYEERGFELTHLAGDRCDVFSDETCDRVLKEIEDYSKTYITNQNASKKARIEQLEKELAKLKED